MPRFQKFTHSDNPCQNNLKKICYIANFLSDNASKIHSMKPRATFFPAPPAPLNNVGSKHCQPDMKKIALATFGSPSEMRNRTWNQHCKGEGGRAEEENLIFFKSFGKDCLRGLFLQKCFNVCQNWHKYSVLCTYQHAGVENRVKSIIMQL